MTSPAISIIVPVYNVENYLCACIDSILGQTMDDFEIILVDDGSTDTSGKLCDEYAVKDARIQVIHKKNGGLSSARNAGLDVATGDYVGFIDSDDYADEEMYASLYAGILSAGADMAACGIINHTGTIQQAQCATLEEFTCSSSEAFGYILVGQKIPGSICNKLIARSRIGNNRFPVGKIYEDAFFTRDLISSIRTVYVTTQPYYHYVHRIGSITTMQFSQHDLDILEVYESIYTLVCEQYPSLVKQADFRRTWAYFTVFDKMLLCDDYKQLKEYLRVKNYLTSHVGIGKTNPFFSRSRRLAAVALRVNVRIYRALMLSNLKRTWGSSL